MLPNHYLRPNSFNPPYARRGPAGFDHLTGKPNTLARASFYLPFKDAGAGIVDTVPMRGGVSATFTRATSSWTNLSDGTIGLVASGSPRSFYSPAGVYLGYLAEGARTNLCQRGEDFANVWAVVGTPTISAGTTTLGALSLSTIGDDSAAALEGYTQTITFTGDAVKAISIYVKKATSTSSVVRVRDTTGAADRLLAAITWSGTVPVVTMTTGTDLTGTPAQQGSSGVYRLSFATTSVTAANTNSLQVYPATDAALSVANTGTIEWGGVQAEDATFPSSLIRTPGSATVTRNADVLTYPFTIGTAGTLLVAYRRQQTGSIGGVAALQQAAGVANNRVDFRADNATSLITSGGALQAGMVGTASPVGSNGKAAIAFALNDAALSIDGVLSATDTSVTLPLSIDTLRVGGIDSGPPELFGPISSVGYIPFRVPDAVLQQLTT